MIQHRNNHHIVKVGWLTRAIKTHNFHCLKIRDKSSWTLTDTANALGRSLGSISEDVTIASWFKTHESKLKSFKYAKDALAFIRDKKRSLMVELPLD